MPRKFPKFISSLLVIFAALTCGPVAAQGPILLSETHVIPDIENRPITYHVNRWDNGNSYPIILIIDGSGCGGALRPGFSQVLNPQHGPSGQYARLTLTKPGIDPYATDPRDCSAEYRERYSIDSAVLDHLRVLQHMRSTAAWWNGELYVWGWSDGGDIGARLISYYPGVIRAMLGAQGGGYTMAQHIEDFWDCAADRNSVEGRETCLAVMREWFAEVKAQPLASLGRSESHQLWRSRLFADLVPLLADTQTELLIVHGALDRDSTPVESARLLVNRLRDAEFDSLVYCEIAKMAHGTDSLAPEQGLRFEQATLHWLLDKSDAQERLREFCDPDPPMNMVAPPLPTTDQE